MKQYLSLGYIWLFLAIIEDSLDSYIRMMVTETKMVKRFYKHFSLLRDAEVFFNFKSLFFVWVET